MLCLNTHGSGLIMNHIPDYSGGTVTDSHRVPLPNPNPDKPEPKKIYFYHENTKVRKHEKENLISHFLFFRGFVIVFNSFANFARTLRLRD